MRPIVNTIVSGGETSSSQSPGVVLGKPNAPKSAVAAKYNNCGKKSVSFAESDELLGGSIIQQGDHHGERR